MVIYVSFSASVGYFPHSFCTLPLKNIFQRESAAKRDVEQRTQSTDTGTRTIYIYLWFSVTFSVVASSSRQWHPGFCTVELRLYSLRSYYLCGRVEIERSVYTEQHRNVSAMRSKHWAGQCSANVIMDNMPKATRFSCYCETQPVDRKNITFETFIVLPINFKYETGKWGEKIAIKFLIYVVFLWSNC